MECNYQNIIQLAVQLDEYARSVGITNIFQPGLVKEIIIANQLKHTVITTKGEADAYCDVYNDNFECLLREHYEYLSCKEGGSGQFDRMFKLPLEKRQKSLNRIRRNKYIFFAVFYASEQTKVKVIYQLEPAIVAQETERQLDVSQNAISHVGFSEAWVERNGVVVYQGN